MINGLVQGLKKIDRITLLQFGIIFNLFIYALSLNNAFGSQSTILFNGSMFYLFMLFGAVALARMRGIRVASKGLFDEWKQKIFYSVLFFVAFSTLMPMFGSPISTTMTFWVAFGYFIFSVALAETVLFVQVLPKIVSPVWASILFSVFHIGAYMLLNNGVFSLSLILVAGVVNMLFIMLYRRTGDAWLIILLHGIYNLYAFGVIA